MKRWLVVVLWVTVASCGPDVPPSTLRGTSEHFRLFVDDSLVPPAGFSFDDALVALETNWSDTRTILAMPDGQIDYYWLTEDHVVSACAQEASGCFIPNAVYSHSAVHQHELNHAYNFMRKHGYVLPLLSEGTAEAVGCGGADVGAPPVNKIVPWREAVEHSLARDLYEQGMQFARHLIVTEGADAFVRYYDQVPNVANADVFGSNFETFWGRSLDDVWAEMHVLDPQKVSVTLPVCPCSLSSLPTDGTVVPRGYPGHPYFTLPDPTGETFSFASPDRSIYISDCDRSITSRSGTGRLLARIGQGHYVRPDDAVTASVANFIADTCAAAVPYDLSDYVGYGRFSIVVARPDNKELTVFLQLRVPMPGNLKSPLAPLSVCADCGFAQPECQEQPYETPIAVQGTFYVRVKVPGGTTVSPLVGLEFAP